MSVELEKARSEVLALKRELSAVKLELRVAGTKKDESPALKAEVKRLGSEVDALVRENDKLKAANKDLKEQMEAAWSDGKDYRALAESEGKSCRKSEAELKSLKEDLAAAKEEIERLGEKCREYYGKAEGMEAEYLGKARESEKHQSALEKAEAGRESLKTDLETAQNEIARLKDGRRKSEAEVKKMRGLFSPGPDLERQKLRDRLKKAENELWRLKDVRDK